MTDQQPTPEDLLRPGDWFRVDANTETRSAIVHIYGTIGDSMWWDDVASPQLVRELDALDVDEITLYVNSPGGFAKDGVAIMNALSRNKARVVANIDGLAASAATIVILGADEIVMGPGAQMMIHDAWNIGIGDAAALLKVSERLDKTSQNLAGLYAQRAGGTADEWRAAMLAETWYTAEEAVEAGLADRTGELPAADDARNAIPIDAAARAFGWQHAGRAAAEAPYMPGRATRRGPAAASLALNATPPPAPQPEHSTTKGGPTMSDAFTQGVRETLGLPADTSDENTISALQERLKTPTAPTLPEGVVTIEKSQLDELRADANAGREARDAQLQADRERTVDSAIHTGRIAPARRNHWLNLIKADPAEAETLNNLEPGLIPLEAAGHTGGVDQAADEDAAAYSKVYPTEKEG